MASTSSYARTGPDIQCKLKKREDTFFFFFLEMVFKDYVAQTSPKLLDQVILLPQPAE